MSIIWLASYPKSGNTWLRKFLQACVVGPPFRLNMQHPRFRGDLAPSDYQAVSQVPITKTSIADQLYLRHAVLWNLTNTIGGGDLYLKTHHSLTSQHRIEMIPHGLTKGAIYVVRDPRDVAISYAHHFGVSIDEAIHHMGHPSNTIFDREQAVLAHGIGDWSGHVHLWKNREYPINRAMVYYEHMLRRPHSTFRHVLSYLGIQVSQDRFNWALTATRFGKMQQQEADQGFSERSQQNNQFFRSGKSGEWRSKLTYDQIRRIEDQHGEVMEELGYECEGRAAA